MRSQFSACLEEIVVARVRGELQRPVDSRCLNIRCLPWTLCVRDSLGVRARANHSLLLPTTTLFFFFPNMFVRLITVLVATVAIAVEATPVRRQFDLQCVSQDPVILALQSLAVATPFCSSLLDISTATVTTTSALDALTTQTITSTATQSTILTGQISTITS